MKLLLLVLTILTVTISSVYSIKTGDKEHNFNGRNKNGWWFFVFDKSCTNTYICTNYYDLYRRPYNCIYNGCYSHI